MLFRSRELETILLLSESDGSMTTTSKFLLALALNIPTISWRFVDFALGQVRRAARCFSQLLD